MFRQKELFIHTSLGGRKEQYKIRIFNECISCEWQLSGVFSLRDDLRQRRQCLGEA